MKKNNTQKNEDSYDIRLKIYLFLMVVLMFLIALMLGYWIGEAIQYYLESQSKTGAGWVDSGMAIIQGNSVLGVSSPITPFLSVMAVVTAYNPVPEQTDSTPDIMASGNRVYEGAIACPRRIRFGVSVGIDGKVYVCEDRTSDKYDGRFDILMFSRSEALEWGRQFKEITIYD